MKPLLCKFLLGVPILKKNHRLNVLKKALINLAVISAFGHAPLAMSCLSWMTLNHNCLGFS
jgi:hypothetical protein